MKVRSKIIGIQLKSLFEPYNKAQFISDSTHLLYLLQLQNILGLYLKPFISGILLCNICRHAITNGGNVDQNEVIKHSNHFSLNNVHLFTVL